MKLGDFGRKPTLSSALVAATALIALFVLFFVVELASQVSRLQQSVSRDENQVEQNQQQTELMREVAFEKIRTSGSLHRMRQMVRNSHTSGNRLSPGNYTASGLPIVMFYEQSRLVTIATNREKPSELNYHVAHYIDRTEQTIDDWQELHVAVIPEIVQHFAFTVDLVPFKKHAFELTRNNRGSPTQPMLIRYWLEPDRILQPDIRAEKKVMGKLPAFRTIQTRNSLTSNSSPFVLREARPNNVGIWFEHDLQRRDVESNDNSESQFLEFTVVCRDKQCER